MFDLKAWLTVIPTAPSLPLFLWGKAISVDMTLYGNAADVNMLTRAAQAATLTGQPGGKHR